MISSNVLLICSDKSDAAFLVSLTTDVNIPDNVVVPFDLVHYDRGSNHNLSSNTYVAPVDGTYMFYGTLYCLEATGCGNRLYVDGDVVVYSNEATAVDSTTWSKMLVNWYLNEGQMVQFETAAGNDISGASDELQTYFGGHLLF